MQLDKVSINDYTIGKDFVYKKNKVKPIFKAIPLARYRVQINDFAHCQVMEEAFLASEKILASVENKKFKFLFAVSELNICGILVSNVAKKEPLRTL